MAKRSPKSASERYEADLRKLVNEAVKPVLAANKQLAGQGKALKTALLNQQRRIDEHRLGRMFMRNSGDIDRADDPWMSPGIQYAGNISAADRARMVSMASAAGRALYIRNGTAGMAVELHVAFAIGNGLNYAFSLPKRDQDRFMEAWNEWWFSNQSSIAMNMSGSGCDRQAIRTEKGQGEVLVRWHPCFDDWKRGRRALPLGIEIMDTTRIDDSINEPWSAESRTYTSQGIKYDSRGVIEGMYLFPIDPGLGWSQSEYVPAFDPKIGQQLALYYDPKQGGLQRGADNGGLLALDLVLDGADLRTQMIRRKRLEARRLASVTTDEDGGSIEGVYSESLNDYSDSANVAETEDGTLYDPDTGQVLSGGEGAPRMPSFEEISQSISVQLATPGAVPVLPAGWSFKDAGFSQATDYQPLQRDILMAIAVCYKVPYPWISQDASQGNMSSNKAIIQPFERECEWTQEHYINSVASITARNAIIAANAVGIIRTAANGRVPYGSFKILGNKFPSFQQDKDMRVLIMAWANRVITFDEMITQSGKDPEDHKLALKKDQEFYKELGAYEYGVPATISPQFMADFMRSDGSENQPTIANPVTGN